MTHVVTLLSKPGCHLCNDAREAVARIAQELDVRWQERDITLEPADFTEYGDRIPVILIDGREHGYWTVDEDRLRRALTR